MLNIWRSKGHHLFSRKYFLGPPKDRKSYKDALLKRFHASCRPDGEIDDSTAKTQAAAELAFSYLDKVIDRQISKTGGLLTFNSILLAVIFTHSIFDDHKQGRLWLTTLLLFSCILLLIMLPSVWSSAQDFESPTRDLCGSMQVCCERTRLLSISALLSLVAVFTVLIMEYLYGLH